jgi:hypothetical protein
MVVIGTRNQHPAPVGARAAPAELRAEHHGVGGGTALGKLGDEGTAEETVGRLLPVDRNALGVDVVVEEIARGARPRIAHLARGQLPLVGGRPLDVRGVEVERLAGIGIRERLVGRARIRTLGGRELYFDARRVIDPGKRSNPQPETIAVAGSHGGLLVDVLVAHPQVTLPDPATHPARTRTLADGARQIVGRPVDRVLQFGVHRGLGNLHFFDLGLLRLLCFLELREPLLQRRELCLEQFELGGGRTGCHRARRRCRRPRRDVRAIREASRPRSRRDDRGGGDFPDFHEGSPVGMKRGSYGAKFLRDFTSARVLARSDFGCGTRPRSAR